MRRRPRTSLDVFAAVCAWLATALLLVAATGEIWIGCLVAALGPAIGIGWSKWPDRRRFDHLDSYDVHAKRVYIYDSDGKLTQTHNH